MESCTKIENCFCNIGKFVDAFPDSSEVVSRQFKSLEERLKNLSSRFDQVDGSFRYSEKILEAFSLLVDEHRDVAKGVMEMFYDMVFILSALSNIGVLDEPLNSNTLQQCQVLELVSLIKSKVNE